MAGGKKKAAKFIKKGHLKAKLKQRNDKKRVKSLKEKRKGKYEDDDGAPRKKKTPAELAADNSGRKDESDMMNDMDVDDFLNEGFLDSDNDDDENGDAAPTHDDEDDDSDDEDAAMNDDGDSSEEEDENALDPRYMTSFPSLGAGDDDDEDETTAGGEPPADDDDEDMPESVGRTTLTMELLIKAENECFEKHSAAGLRRLMKIFSDACRSSDAADVSKEGEIMYDIQSSAVYNRLMLNVFRKVHVTFATLVGQDDAAAATENKTRVDERKWKKHALVIRRFFSCVNYVLAQTTAQDIQQFVLRELAHYIPYVLPCPKSAGKLQRTLLKLWAKSLNTGVCMLAFVRIRDLALQMPFPFMESSLKGIYIAYMRNTKFTNESTLPHHVLLGNCVVELYGLDMASSYQHAFVYIRELAIAIRKTITSPSPDTFKAVLNWQFFNQLRVWTAVVSAYPAENQLRALLYPLCQLLFAVVRLASTIRYAPMRFQCVALLQQLAAATNAFVPTAPVLLEILNMAPFSTSYRGASKSDKNKSSSSSSTKVDIDLSLIVKLSKSHLDNKRVHDALITRLFELLQRDCDVYKFHVGFPEFSVPLLLTLTKFTQNCLVPKWKSLARGLIENLKKRSEWIRQKRSNLDIAPKDVDKMDAFLKSEREAAVKKMVVADADELHKKLATQQQQQQQQQQKKSNAEYNSDDDSADEAGDANEKTEKKKKKKTRGGKKNKVAATVDDAAVEQVKKMTLKEFKKSVAAVDAADVVEDFAFSSDEE